MHFEIEWLDTGFLQNVTKRQGNQIFFKKHMSELSLFSRVQIGWIVSKILLFFFVVMNCFLFLSKHFDQEQEAVKNIAHQRKQQKRLITVILLTQIDLQTS